MSQQSEGPLRAAHSSFFAEVAERILGHSNVATATTDTLRRLQIDGEKLTRILNQVEGGVIRSGGFEFKRITADPETPESFGLLVRRKG